MSKTIVGIIGDTHEPFCHPQYRDFCYKTFNRFGVNKIVHIGDEVDNYALSYHEHDPDADNSGSEAEKAQRNLEKWYKTFPVVDVIVGNHSALPHRQATTAGIPKRFVKAYEEVWEAPKGWKWSLELEIDHVKYTHGTGSSGQNGAINRATRSRQSTVIGHIHSFGSVSYHASENDLIFGLNAGCGIDVRAYAFQYGRNFVNKPTLGCGIVVDGFQAFFIPMNLGKKFEWIK
jgi:predicted phosphodiesterase